MPCTHPCGYDSNQFRNKDDVFEAVAEMAYAILIETVQTTVAGVASPLEKLERAVDAFLRVQVEAGPFVRVLRAQSTKPGSKPAPRRQTRIATLTDLFSREAVSRPVHRCGRGVCTTPRPARSFSTTVGCRRRT